MDDLVKKASDILSTPQGYLGAAAAGAVGAASMAFLFSKPKPLDLGFDYNKQSTLLEVSWRKNMIES